MFYATTTTTVIMLEYNVQWSIFNKQYMKHNERIEETTYIQSNMYSTIHILFVSSTS